MAFSGFSRGARADQYCWDETTRAIILRTAFRGAARSMFVGLAITSSPLCCGAFTGTSSPVISHIALDRLPALAIIALPSRQHCGQIGHRH
jgi:hypothetical protein